jgi:hypothetical protein
VNLKLGKADSVRSLPRDLQPLRRKDGAAFRHGVIQIAASV